jgi:ADP-heptose:LPS heptosyltransferase
MKAHLIVNNDIDFCLRTAEVGRSVLYTPHAILIHHEQASRGGIAEVYDRSRFGSRWRSLFAKGDPFHNPNLSKQHDDFRPNEEPVRVVHGNRPLFTISEIRRILVIKVDHIGDFVTALPAIRRLKAAFLEATLHVLSSPANVGLAALEPAIDSAISFEFFHERSALGLKAVAPEDLEALRIQLLPYRFDLAIDLRKHPETRPLLRVSGARYLAGFDYAGQFTWLDIALEWEGDRGLHSKRFHVSDDLLHLIDAIITASSSDYRVIAPKLIRDQRRASPVLKKLARLFKRRVVCVHPGSGNEMKQWPTEHFVALIELLVHEAGVNILLIGGAEEVEIVDSILATVQQPENVVSVVGEVGLKQLPALLSRCALYVGNDSGPKHIAAAVGIPTIGIHSGTVDPAEWGPMGPGAVAIARQMSCAPCYLNQLSDCVRDLACIRQIDPGVVLAMCRQFLAGGEPVRGKDFR